jgi:hypothetical protein
VWFIYVKTAVKRSLPKRSLSPDQLNTISPVADQLQKWHTSTGINFAFSESKSNVQHPQQFRMKFSRLLLISTISLVAATLPAQAASYKSTNGTTILNLNESGNSDFAQLPKNSGRYVTFIGGNQVAGGITILRRNAAPNNVTYTGTFEDYVGKPDTGCKGTIALNRTILVGGGVALRSEWRIGQSGSRCESPVGTKFVVNLVENLPVAKDGNYPGDPGSGSASEDYSWNHPLWKVADSTSLNCRATPGGRVVKSYPLGTQLSTRIKGINTFGTDSAGQRWMYIPGSNCFVRHSPTYIRPVSLPY